MCSQNASARSGKCVAVKLPWTESGQPPPCCAPPCAQATPKAPGYPCRRQRDQADQTASKSKHQASASGRVALPERVSLQSGSSGSPPWIRGTVPAPKPTAASSSAPRPALPPSPACARDTTRTRSWNGARATARPPRRAPHARPLRRAFRHAPRRRRGFRHRGHLQRRGFHRAPLRRRGFRHRAPLLRRVFRRREHLLRRGFHRGPLLRRACGGLCELRQRLVCDRRRVPDPRSLPPRAAQGVSRGCCRTSQARSCDLSSTLPSDACSTARSSSRSPRATRIWNFRRVECQTRMTSPRCSARHPPRLPLAGKQGGARPPHPPPRAARRAPWRRRGSADLTSKDLTIKIWRCRPRRCARRGVIISRL